MKVRFYHDILPILNFSKYLFYMRRRSVYCGTKNIQFVKNDLSHKISKKNVLFLKRNNGMVVHSRHSAVYAHILYGRGQYIGNGIVVSWILQSTVHYIPVSVARYLLARLISIHLACGLAKGTTSRDNLLPSLFSVASKPKAYCSILFPSVYCYSLSSGALNHLVMKYNHNNPGLMVIQYINSIETIWLVDLDSIPTLSLSIQFLYSILLVFKYL